jgi:hypothetical protein
MQFGNMFNVTSTQMISGNRIFAGMPYASGIGVYEFIPPTVPNGIYSIEGNTIEDYDVGIEVSNLYAPSIKNANSISVRPGAGGLKKFGISVNNCYLANVKFNSVSAVPIGSNFVANSNGISITSSGRSFVLCNTVSKLEKGIVWNNFSPSSKMLGGNEMDVCFDELFLNYNPGLGRQYGTVSIGNSKVDVPSDNQWFSTSGVINSNTNSFQSNNGQFGIITGTLFETRSIVNPYVGFVNINQGGLAFNQVYYNLWQGSLSNVCAYTPTNKFDPDQENAIALNLIYNNETESSEMWQSKMYLYNELLTDTTLLNSDSIMAIQLDSMAATSLGAITEIYQDLLTALSDTSLSELEVEELLIEIRDRANAVETSYLADELEKQWIDFISSSYMDNWLSLSENDKESLNYFASYCTRVGGNPAFVAHNMFLLLDSINSNYIDSCQFSNSRFATDDPGRVDEILVKVQPNPASSFFDIILSRESSDKKCKVDVIDAIGQCVFSSVVEQSSKIRVSSKEFVDGIYTVRLFIGGKYYNSKLIITH